MAEAVIPAWHYKKDFIFNPVKGTVNCFGGFDKITAVVTDGSPAVEESTVLLVYLKRNMEWTSYLFNEWGTEKLHAGRY